MPNNTFPSLADVTREAKELMARFVHEARAKCPGKPVLFLLGAEMAATVVGIPLSMDHFVGYCQNLALWASSAYKDYDFSVLCSTQSPLTYHLQLTPIDWETQKGREEAQSFREEVLHAIRLAGGEDEYRKKYPRRAMMLDNLPGFDWTSAYKRHRRC